MLCMPETTSGLIFASDEHVFTAMIFVVVTPAGIMTTTVIPFDNVLKPCLCMLGNSRGDTKGMFLHAAVRTILWNK